jgi:hypothetical protein
MSSQEDMGRAVVRQVARIVEQACASEDNMFGYNIWTHHITLVVQNGLLLAERLGADREIVELAALLHDYAGIKNRDWAEEHHLYGQAEAGRILGALGYPPDRIRAIQHCIATHRGSVREEWQSVEAEIVANADAMTHLQRIPSLLYLAFVEHGMSVDEGVRWLRAKLGRSWAKLSPAVQEIMQPTYDAALAVLTVPPE